MLYRRTLLFIHFIYNSSHLLIPNFQSAPSLIPHLPRKASVPLIQISGCSTVASIPTPLPPPSLPPGTYCYSYWAHASWVPLCMCVCLCESLSHVWLFETLWTVAHQAPLSMEFSREEYWSGLPFPSLGGLPNPGIKPRSPGLQADSLLSGLPGRPCCDWMELVGKVWGYATTAFSFLMT